ncbi:ATP-binding protein [Cupriavidus basilensis]|uniref:PAS domain-containing sensor histidine kinase n=1 Tax=Cupriavidus basilensis TaxID=68895 RepID=UPI0039F6EE80
MSASTPHGGEHLKLRDVTEAMRKMMAAIDSSNRVLRAITDVHGTALAILAPGGRFLSANSSAAAMFGYSIADLIGKSLVELVRDSDQKRVSEGFSGSASSAFHSFGTVLRGRGDRDTDILLHKQPIADSEGNFSAFLVVFEEPVILQNGSIEALSRPESDLRRLYAHLMIGQEKERKRVSSELHDGLGQALTLIKLMVEDSLLRIERGNVEEAVALLDTTVLRIRETIGEVRQICNELRPRLLDDLGLAPALASLCRQVEHGSGKVVVIFDCRVREDEVPDSLKADMYRVAQEAINNVVKHAVATEIRVTLQRNASDILLTIQDNGIGFEQLPLSADDASFSGLGLIGMQERVESNGGSFSLQSSECSGTLVSATWRA